jgi:hypothetical protein
MAAEQTTSADVDSFEFSEPSGTNQNSGTINLDPGETIAGNITAYKPWVGDYGLIEIDGRGLYLNQTMRDQLVEALVVGKQVAHRKDKETDSFKDSNGETVEYNPRNLGFPKE